MVISYTWDILQMERQTSIIGINIASAAAQGV